MTNCTSMIKRFIVQNLVNFRLSRLKMSNIRKSRKNMSIMDSPKRKDRCQKWSIFRIWTSIRCNTWGCKDRRLLVKMAQIFIILTGTGQIITMSSITLLSTKEVRTPIEHTLRSTEMPKKSDITPKAKKLTLIWTSLEKSELYQLYKLQG